MKKKNMILILIFVGSILLDQGSKFLIESNMELFDKIPVIPGFFSITYTQNTGAAWSMLEGKMIFFYLITLVAMALLIWYFRTLKEEQFLSKVGIVLMVAGAAGNFIDRLAFQYVRDFLDFIIFGYDFPIFNIADSCLCIGIALVVIEEFLDFYKVGKKWKQNNT